MLTKTSSSVSLILTLLCACMLCGSWPARQKAAAADGEGAFTVKQGHFESYPLDRQAAAYRTGCDGTDVVTGLGTISSVATYSLAGPTREGARQSLALSCRFSTAGANATVWVAYYYYNGTSYKLLHVDQPFSGGSVTTIAATAAVDDSASRYIANTYVFDSYGATHALVLITAVSAGTVDLWVGSY